MTVGDFLAQASRDLHRSGITTARLDVLILLEDVLQMNRASIFAHPEKELSASNVSSLNNYITQRKRHVPLAYIRGKASFYGRYFVVNKHVLVPRPETEAMINILRELSLPAEPNIADIGTGSGCLGITAALELPHARVFLYDIDVSALKVAVTNIALHGVSAQPAKQDLLVNCREDFEVILANLPYIPTAQGLNRAATHEPRHAIFSGEDGLDHYRQFFKQIALLASSPRHLIIEAEPYQHLTLQQLAAQSGYMLRKSEGFIQHFALVAT